MNTVQDLENIKVGSFVLLMQKHPMTDNVGNFYIFEKITETTYKRKFVFSKEVKIHIIESLMDKYTINSKYVVLQQLNHLRGIDGDWLVENYPEYAI